MARKPRISIGCHVQGRLGSFLPCEDGDTSKRRKRAYIDGIVVKSLPQKMFRVYWNSIDCYADHRINSIHFKSLPDIGTTQADLDMLCSDPNKYVAGGADQLRRFIERSFRTPTTHNSTTATEANGRSTGSTTLSTSSTTTTFNSDPRLSNEIEYLARGDENTRRLLTEARAASAALDADSGLPNDNDETENSHSASAASTSASAASTSAASTRLSLSEITEERSQILLPARITNRATSTSASTENSNSASATSTSASAASTTAASTRLSLSEITVERSQILLPARITNRATSTSVSTENSNSASATSTSASAASTSAASTNDNASTPGSAGPNTNNPNSYCVINPNSGCVIVEDVNEDDDEDGSNPNYDREHLDPAEIIQDLIEDGDSHGRKWALYLREKKALIDNSVRVTCGNRNNAVEWTVCDDVKADTVPEHVNFNRVQGIKGFDFGNLTEQTGVKRNSNRRINLMHLLLHLWPGSLKAQLRQLNDLIKIHNDTKSRGQRNKKLISKREYLKFLGILILARIEGMKGGRLWTDGDKSEGIRKMKGIAKEHMTYTRFRELQDLVPFLWQNEELKDAGDEWWEVADVCRLFAENRRRTIQASNVKTADESMSAMRPRTTKSANLPHISFILRKPKPLGTEFKTIACAYLKVLLSIEICRSKDSPFGREHEQQLKKKTTSCSVCLMRAANQRAEYRRTVHEAGESWKEIDWPTADNATDDLFLGDSWFGSVATARALKDASLMDDEAHSILQIKTATAGYPKKFIEDTMVGWPGGSHLVLSGTVQGVKLYAVGYKYSSKKNLCFVFTEGASHTEPGTPYVANWKDENGNSRFRNVPRPACCSKFFEHSNTIDVHNQLRQGDLALEEHWVTSNGIFRIFTTIFGMCITDAYNGYKHHLKNNHRHKNVTIEEFANMLCLDLIENKEDDGVEIDRQDGAWSIGSFPAANTVNDGQRVSVQGMGLVTTGGNSSSSTISSLTNPPFLSPFLSPEGANYKRIVDIDDFCALEAGKHYLVRTKEKYSCKRQRLSSTQTGQRVEFESKRTKTCACRDCWKQIIDPGTGKRKRNKVSTYCAECKAPPRCDHYWLCEECAPAHRQSIKDAIMKGER